MSQAVQCPQGPAQGLVEAGSREVLLYEYIPMVFPQVPQAEVSQHLSDQRSY